ncbi:MAG: helix-turn-helix transcriptional regulator [Rhodocyclaceae bacterium]|nr:helix-turn-helix transcriptional regulator [Rhodocyclaceae bacterium]
MVRLASISSPAEPKPAEQALTTSHEAESEALMRVFSENLTLAMDKSGWPTISANRYGNLSERYGVSRQLAYRWCEGRALPSPAILLRLAADLGVSMDELFGGTVATKRGGVRIPIFRLADPDIEASASNFVEDGYVNAPSQSITGTRKMAVVRNWNESLNPSFLEHDDLFIDLTIRQITAHGIYVVRTATTTSIRIAEIDSGSGENRIKLFRTTPVNKISSTYLPNELHFNEAQRFDVAWAQPGVLIVGRVAGYMRTILPSVQSLLL